MKRTLSPRAWGKVKNTSTPIRGYRGEESEVYCLTCLVKDEAVYYDKNKPITKQAAFKEGLVCEVCHQPLCPPKHSKFLQRVTDAKSKTRQGLR